MEKISVRTKSMTTEKDQINVEKQTRMLTKKDVTAGALARDTFNPHVEYERVYHRYASKVLLIKHPTFKSDLPAALECVE